MIIQRKILKIISVIIFTSAGIHCTMYSQNIQKIVLTVPRIGITIDSSERSYFGLFPKISNYDSAQVVQSQSDTFSVRISRVSAVDTMVALSKDEFQFLKRYIDGHEVLPEENVADYWTRLDSAYTRLIQRKIIQAKYNRMNEPVSLIWKTINGGKIKAKILYANDSALVIIPDNRKYDYHVMKTVAHLFKARDIDIIRREGTPFETGLIGRAFLTSGAVAAALLLFTEPTVSNSGTHYEEWYPPIIVSSILSGIIMGVCSGIANVLLNPGESYAIHGSAEQYKKILNTLKSFSVFPDQPSPEIIQFIEIQHDMMWESISQ